MLWTQKLWVLGPQQGAHTSLVLQVAVVVMCLVSIILYRAVMAIIVSKSNNAFLSAWVSVCCLSSDPSTPLVLCLL